MRSTEIVQSTAMVVKSQCLSLVSKSPTIRMFHTIHAHANDFTAIMQVNKCYPQLPKKKCRIFWS